MVNGMKPIPNTTSVSKGSPEMKTPFNWMIQEWVDLADGFLTWKNAPDLVPTDGVKPENHKIFIMNWAHLENRRDSGDIQESTFYNRALSLLNHYEF